MSSDPIGIAGGFNTYLYANANPLSYIDPYGLWALGDPLPDWLVNSSAGFGDSVSSALTLGLYSTADARRSLGIDGGVNQCSGAYTAGKYAGYAWGAATLWAAGLNRGANSVFWSGYSQGARGIAEGLGGTTLESTPIGSALDFASNSLGIPGLGPVWKAASATFAANASGTATAVILSDSATSVWATIEEPVLSARGIPILFH